MKQICSILKKIFGIRPKNITTTSTTRWVSPPQPTPPTLDKVYSHNVNGVEEDLDKICSTGVLTIYSDCQTLSMGCFVCADSQANDFTTLAGKYFHDYSNDVVYHVQEVDGMIINLGRCNL